MTLTKDKICKKFSNEFDISPSYALEITSAILREIEKSLERKKEVYIKNFGIWHTRSKRERRGRNPITEESIQISPRRVVLFRTSQNLLNKLNGKEDT